MKKNIFYFNRQTTAVDVNVYQDNFDELRIKNDKIQNYFPLQVLLNSIWYNNMDYSRQIESMMDIQNIHLQKEELQINDSLFPFTNSATRNKTFFNILNRG